MLASPAQRNAKVGWTGDGWTGAVNRVETPQGRVTRRITSRPLSVRAGIAALGQTWLQARSYTYT